MCGKKGERENDRAESSEGAEQISLLSFCSAREVKGSTKVFILLPRALLDLTYLENSVHPCGNDFSSMSFELQVKSHFFQVTFNNNPICFHTIFCFPYQPEFGGLFCLCCRCSVAKSCPTLHDPTDCSPPGSSVHGILQARILEWVAILFSRGSS